MQTAKWPKILPPMTPEQRRISDEFMKVWHQELPTPLRDRREVQPRVSGEEFAAGIQDDG